jgi:hypothetical protein
MNESTSNEPVGGSELEVVEPGGNRRPMTETESKLFRQASTRMSASELQEIREKEEAAEEKEAAARARGEESWKELDERTNDEDAQNVEPHQFEVPDETPREHIERVEGFMEQLAPITQQLNIPAGEVQEVVDFAVSLAVTDQSGVNLGDPQACYTVLQNRYGAAEAAKIVDDAYDAVQQLGPKMKEFLDSTMLGNDPSVLYSLASWKRGDLKMTPAKAQAELDKLTKDPKGAYRDANAAGHKSAVARANMLYRVLAKADAKAEARKAAEPAKPKPPAKSGARAAQEAELKSLLAHPAYRDRGHRESATVRARVEALYGTLYPGNE